MRRKFQNSKKQYKIIAMPESTSVRVVEVSDDEILKFINSDLSISVPVDHLNIRSNVGGSGLETFVHGSVAIDEPLGNLNGLTDAVVIAVIGLDNFSVSTNRYLARLRHSSFEKRPPFSTPE